MYFLLRFILILIQFLHTHKRPTKRIYFYLYFFIFFLFIFLIFSPWLVAKYIKSYLRSAEPNASARVQSHTHTHTYTERKWGYGGTHIEARPLANTQIFAVLWFIYVCMYVRMYVCMYVRMHEHIVRRWQRKLAMMTMAMAMAMMTMMMMMQVIHAENEQQFWFTRQTTPAPTTKATITRIAERGRTTKRPTTIEQVLHVFTQCLLQFSRVVIIIIIFFFCGHLGLVVSHVLCPFSPSRAASFGQPPAVSILL